MSLKITRSSEKSLGVAPVTTLTVVRTSPTQFYIWQKTGCGIQSFCPSKRKTGCGCWDTT